MTLADGRTTAEGEIAGLGVTEINVGGQMLKLDLAKASLVTVQVAEVGAITATVVATVDGKEVGAHRKPPVRARRNGREPGRSVVRGHHPARAGRREGGQRLPDVFTDVAVGGSGRYLIFHMPKLK